MKSIRQRVNDFLKAMGMDFKEIDMDKYCRLFAREMVTGLQGKESSLKMIPTYIEMKKEIPCREPVIVLDAGGTNLRAAVVRFNREGKALISDFARYPMPGIGREVTEKEFFRTIAGYLHPLLDASEKIGFCFSYPTEMMPDKDGKVINFCKEIEAKEVEGKLIGRGLLASIKSAGYKTDKHIVLLNDTVSTMLAAQASAAGHLYSEYIGFVLGTGTNSCYLERNRNITKNRELIPDNCQIINIESGNFDKVPGGIIDRQLDRATVDPGQHTFEKMISGAYLGPLCAKTIQKAADDNLLSSAFKEKMVNLQSLDTRDINSYLFEPHNQKNTLSSRLHGSREEDYNTIYYLIESLVERAAKLAAINLASVALKIRGGRNPDKLLCISAEGTTFYRVKSLQTKIKFYLDDYLMKKNKCRYKIINIKDSSLIGAAIAGLTN
jgi:hexokinase